MFTSKYHKGLSPLITTILLIVVTFALIGIILGWGKNFTNQTKTTLASFSETYTKDSTSMIKPIKFYPNNRLVVNDLMSKDSLTINGYRILSDKNLPGLNEIQMLSQPLVLSTGDSTSLIISRPPESKFDIQLLTKDNKYITVYDITNYPLEPISPVITSPTNSSSFTPDTNILFSQTTTGGDGSYSCEWKADSNIISTSCDDFNYSFSTNGSKTIYLKVTDLEDNTKTVSSSITIIPPLVVNITSPSNNSVNLINNSINFNSSIFGGFGEYSCVWDSNIDSTISTSCDFSTSSLSVGTHLITLNVTDSLSSNKIITESIYVVLPLDVNITTPENNSVLGVNTDIGFNSSISGGVGDYNCNWYLGSTNIHNGCSYFNYSFGSTGSYDLNLVVTDHTLSSSTNVNIEIVDYTFVVFNGSRLQVARANTTRLYRWSDGGNYCSSVTYEGFSDWRSGTNDELSTIYTAWASGNKSKSALSGLPLINNFRKDVYWSSGPTCGNQYSSGVQTIDFSNGDSICLCNEGGRDIFGHILCVRNR